jgi:hypothetical protein
VGGRQYGGDSRESVNEIADSFAFVHPCNGDHRRTTQ